MNPILISMILWIIFMVIVSWNAGKRHNQLLHEAIENENKLIDQMKKDLEETKREIEESKLRLAGQDIVIDVTPKDQICHHT